MSQIHSNAKPWASKSEVSSCRPFAVQESVGRNGEHRAIEESSAAERLVKVCDPRERRTISVGSDARFKDRLARNNLKFNSDVISWLQEECENRAEISATDSG
uniref:Uncharacterized protein n=1 Tax=Ditylenchus dipsaci TaxID=166011 RepID=A0A915DSM4_9BILA